MSYLLVELGHSDSPEGTALFTQYLSVSLEVKYRTGVKAKMLVIYVLTFVLQSLDQITLTLLS
jgi:hypothetical protein